MNCLSCNNVPNQIFRSDIEPKPYDNGKYTFNEGVYTSKITPDFVKVKNISQGCPSEGYTSFLDARLVSAPYGNYPMVFDKAPMNSLPSCDVYKDSSLNNYGKNYKGYSDINTGQITYYLDKSIEDPFFIPVFSTSALSIGKMYIDPMGSKKPEYTRKPINCPDVMNTKRDNYDGKLSFIRDSLSHRDDIISLQMRARNRERFEPVYYQ